MQLDGLRAVNGQFAFVANSLAFRQYKVANAKADATLDNGTLRISNLTGQAWGGSLAASGSADARSQRVAVKLAASGVNVNALLKDVAGKDLLEGTGRVSADVNTTGASLGALRSNLAGVAALELRDGAIKGINLARSMRQAKAALSGRQDASTKASATEKTDFSELTRQRPHCRGRGAQRRPRREEPLPAHRRRGPLRHRPRHGSTTPPAPPWSGPRRARTAATWPRCAA